MPTNLKLNDDLLAAAVKLGHFKSKQEAVNTALAEFVQRRRRLKILDLAGKIDFDPNWDYKKTRQGDSGLRGRTLAGKGHLLPEGVGSFPFVERRSVVYQLFEQILCEQALE